MKCLEFHELLQRWLDGDATVAQASHEHLAECPDCRSLHALAQSLLLAIPARALPKPPANLAKRTTDLVLEDQRIRFMRRRFRFRVTIGLAASLLIMAVAGYFFLPEAQGPDVPGTSIVEEKKQADDPASLTQSADQARQAALALSGRLADSARQQTERVLSAATPVTLPEFENFPDVTASLDLEPAALALVHAGQEVAEGLEPVARTARRAFSFFYRELPVLRRTP